MNISIYKNRAFTDLNRGLRLPKINAGISCQRIGISALPERVFNDARSIGANPQLQVKHLVSAVSGHEILVALGRLMPAGVLNESVIGAQIHTHRLTTPGAVRHKLAGNTHVTLGFNHELHGLIVVVSIGVARLGALPQAVITLRVKQALFRETS